MQYFTLLVFISHNYYNAYNELIAGAALSGTVEHWFSHRVNPDDVEGAVVLIFQNAWLDVPANGNALVYSSDFDLEECPALELENSKMSCPMAKLEV